MDKPTKGHTTKPSLSDGSVFFADGTRMTRGDFYSEDFDPKRRPDSHPCEKCGLVIHMDQSFGRTLEQWFCFSCWDALRPQQQNALQLARTLTLGIIRKRFPHLVELEFTPPSISERREIMNLLLKMIDIETFNLAGGDTVIENAISHGRG